MPREKTQTDSICRPLPPQPPSSRNRRHAATNVPQTPFCPPSVRTDTTSNRFEPQPLRLDLDKSRYMSEGRRRGSRGSLDRCTPLNDVGSESPVAGRSAHNPPALNTGKSAHHQFLRVKSAIPAITKSRSSSLSRSLQATEGHSLSSAVDPPRKRVECICGRPMQKTQNPMGKFPPNAVLYCQQGGRCKQKMVVQKDWFYSCRCRSSYHGTKDGMFKICFSCSISATAKQERVRKNHQLLIKQLKANQTGKVLITDDTRRYIETSTSSNTNDETIRLLRQTYLNDCRDAADEKDRLHVPAVRGETVVLKEGFMCKKGNFWNKAYKQRYFKLTSNRQLAYFKDFEPRGVADLNNVQCMGKKGTRELTVNTPSREWKFMCESTVERDAWYGTIERMCVSSLKSVKQKPRAIIFGAKAKLKKAKTCSALLKRGRV